MPTIKTPLEAALYTALKRITLYDSPERLRRASEKNWGVPFEEAIEMAYDNVQGEAKIAIKGVRFPKPKVAEARAGAETEGGRG